MEWWMRWRRRGARSRAPARAVARDLCGALEPIDHVLLGEVTRDPGATGSSHCGASLLVREEHRDAGRHRPRIRLREQHAADPVGHVALRKRIALREHGDAQRHEVEVAERGVVAARGYPGKLRGRQHGLLIEPLA